MKNKFLPVVICIALIACKKDDPTENVLPQEQKYDSGVYVVNEGAWGQNNSSITHISNEGEIINDLYLAQNGVELGDVAQSFVIIDGKGYAVINNSQKIEVVGLADFKHLATIEGVSYPRYMVDGGNQTAFLSDGSGQGVIHVVNTTNNTIVSSINVGNGPEKMIVHGEHLFVCNNGGFLTDNRVSVINVTDQTTMNTIIVGDRPVDIVADANDDVWVLCSGETLYDENWNVTGHTNAMLYKIDSEMLTVISSAQIGVTGDHPFNLEISPDGTKIYYENDGVYVYDINGVELPGTLLITEDRGSLNIDPVSGEIWCASVSDFTTPSILSQYTPQGDLIRSYTVGIGANAVVFN